MTVQPIGSVRPRRKRKPTRPTALPEPKGLTPRAFDEALDDGSPRPVDMGEFWGKPAEPIRYLIDPLLAAGEITRLYAQAKVGKSLLMQECAAALATGRQVLGQDVQPLDVLYIDQENTQNNWKTNLSDMGYGPDDDWHRFHWYSLQAWPPLDTKAGGAAVLAKVEQHDVGLVVLDTQSKFLEGEEDRQPTQQAFYQHTLIPLKRLGVAVVIIDHAGNDPSKPRGSSGKRDDVDTVWRAVRVDDRVTLTRTHQRSLHEVGTLVLDRLLDPLRHVLAGEVNKEEQGVAECLAALQGWGSAATAPAARRSSSCAPRSGRRVRRASVIRSSGRPGRRSRRASSDRQSAARLPGSTPPAAVLPAVLPNCCPLLPSARQQCPRSKPASAARPLPL